MLKQLEQVATLPTIRLGLRLYLLSIVRKSELLDATWDELDFENAVWTIPKERMKRSKPHNVYLSRHVLDIFIAFRPVQEIRSTCCRRATTLTLQCRGPHSIASPIS
jgi:integrase